MSLGKSIRMFPEESMEGLSEGKDPPPDWTEPPSGDLDTKRSEGKTLLPVQLWFLARD